MNIEICSRFFVPGGGLLLGPKDQLLPTFFFEDSPYHNHHNNHDCSPLSLYCPIKIVRVNIQH